MPNRELLLALHKAYEALTHLRICTAVLDLIIASARPTHSIPQRLGSLDAVLAFVTPLVETIYQSLASQQCSTTELGALTTLWRIFTQLATEVRTRLDLLLAGLRPGIDASARERAWQAVEAASQGEDLTRLTLELIRNTDLVMRAVPDELQSSLRGTMCSRQELQDAVHRRTGRQVDEEILDRIEVLRAMAFSAAAVSSRVTSYVDSVLGTSPSSTAAKSQQPNQPETTALSTIGEEAESAVLSNASDTAGEPAANAPSTDAHQQIGSNTPVELPCTPPPAYAKSPVSPTSPNPIQTALSPADTHAFETANNLLHRGSALLLHNSHEARHLLLAARTTALTVTLNTGLPGVRKYRLLTRISISLALCSRNHATNFQHAHEYTSKARKVAEALGNVGDIGKCLLDEGEVWVQEMHCPERVEKKKIAPSTRGEGETRGNANHPLPAKATHQSPSAISAQKSPEPYRKAALKAYQTAASYLSGSCRTVDEHNTHALALIGCGKLAGATGTGTGTGSSREGSGNGERENESAQLRAYYFAQAREVVVRARLLPFPDLGSSKALDKTEQELGRLEMGVGVGI